MKDAKSCACGKYFKIAALVEGSKIANATGTLCLKFLWWRTVFESFGAARRLPWNSASFSCTLCRRLQETSPLQLALRQTDLYIQMVKIRISCAPASYYAHFWWDARGHRISILACHWSKHKHSEFNSHKIDFVSSLLSFIYETKFGTILQLDSREFLSTENQNGKCIGTSLKKSFRHCDWSTLMQYVNWVNSESISKQ